MTWSGSWPVARRLEAGVASIDERFVRQWEAHSAETFLVTVVSPAAGTHSRWRVDLAARTVCAVDAGEVPASWEIVGPAELWEQVMSRATNLSVAFRRRQVRYSETGSGDTGNRGPAVAAHRIGMLADLLGITTWQPEVAGGASVASSVQPAAVR
jgi:hypothetical protein